MELLVNSNDEILAYATVGGIDGGQEYNGDIPDDFEDNFKQNYYLLQDNEIAVNPDYQEPEVTIPDAPTGPSAEMLAINALGLQFAKHLAGGE